MFMEYYIDLDFCFNLGMDYILLRLVKRWYGVSDKKKARTWIAAGIGAIFQVMIRLVCENSILVVIAGMFLTPLVMCEVSFLNHHNMIRKYFSLWFLCFVFAGLLESIRLTAGRVIHRYSLHNNAVTDDLIGLAAIVAAIVFVRTMIFTGKELRKNRIYRISMQIDENSINCDGLMDTGNCLYEPFFGKPVIVVIDEQVIQKLREMANEEPERSCIIPYYSVAKEGILQGIRLDRVVLHSDDGDLIDEHVIAAIGNLSAKKRKYQIVLHPDLLGEMG